jgi:hypothetical protein
MSTLGSIADGLFVKHRRSEDEIARADRVSVSDVHLDHEIGHAVGCCQSAFGQKNSKADISLSRQLANFPDDFGKSQSVGYRRPQGIRGGK